MRSLCAVLLVAFFLVGFTASADDPEPDNQEPIVENSIDTEHVLLEVGAMKLLGNSESALNASTLLGLGQYSQKGLQSTCNAASCTVEGTESSCCLRNITGNFMCAPCGSHFPIME